MVQNFLDRTFILNFLGSGPAKLGRRPGFHFRSAKCLFWKAPSSLTWKWVYDPYLLAELHLANITLIHLSLMTSVRILNDENYRSVRRKFPRRSRAVICDGTRINKVEEVKQCARTRSNVYALALSAVAKTIVDSSSSSSGGASTAPSLHP